MANRRQMQRGALSALEDFFFQIGQQIGAAMAARAAAEEAPAPRRGSRALQARGNGTSGGETGEAGKNGAAPGEVRVVKLKPRMPRQRRVKAEPVAETVEVAPARPVPPLIRRRASATPVSADGAPIADGMPVAVPEPSTAQQSFSLDDLGPSWRESIEQAKTQSGS